MNKLFLCVMLSASFAHSSQQLSQLNSVESLPDAVFPDGETVYVPTIRDNKYYSIEESVLDSLRADSKELKEVRVENQKLKSDLAEMNTRFKVFRNIERYDPEVVIAVTALISSVATSIFHKLRK